MTGYDVLLRERGARRGALAPGWLARTVGASLAMGCAWLAEALGFWTVIGAKAIVVHMAALVLGAVVAPTAFGGFLWLVSGLLTTTLMLVMYTPLVGPLIPHFVRSDVEGRFPVDAVIVLSGGLTDDGRITGQALDRLLSAIWVARQRDIATLGLSIVDEVRRGDAITSEVDQRHLISRLAPERTALFVRQVYSTRDEVVAFAGLARAQQWRGIVVVTSPLHTRRACMAFEREGLTVECRPAEGRDYSIRKINTGNSRRLAFQDVLYESVATILYRARGWL